MSSMRTMQSQPHDSLVRALPKHPGEQAAALPLKGESSPAVGKQSEHAKPFTVEQPAHYAAVKSPPCTSNCPKPLPAHAQSVPFPAKPQTANVHINHYVVTRDSTNNHVSMHSDDGQQRQRPMVNYSIVQQYNPATIQQCNPATIKQCNPVCMQQGTPTILQHCSSATMATTQGGAPMATTQGGATMATTQGGATMATTQGGATMTQTNPPTTLQTNPPTTLQTNPPTTLHTNPPTTTSAPQTSSPPTTTPAQPHTNPNQLCPQTTPQHPQSPTNPSPATHWGSNDSQRRPAQHPQDGPQPPNPHPQQSEHPRSPTPQNIHHPMQQPQYHQSTVVFSHPQYYQQPYPILHATTQTAPYTVSNQQTSPKHEPLAGAVAKEAHHDPALETRPQGMYIAQPQFHHQALTLTAPSRQIVNQSEYMVHPHGMPPNTAMYYQYPPPTQSIVGQPTPYPPQHGPTDGTVVMPVTTVTVQPTPGPYMQHHPFAAPNFVPQPNVVYNCDPYNAQSPHQQHTAHMSPNTPEQADFPRRKERVKKKCKVDGCTTQARLGGLCIRHGGGKRCVVMDCCKLARFQGSLCKEHKELQISGVHLQIVATTQDAPAAADSDPEVTKSSTAACQQVEGVTPPALARKRTLDVPEERDHDEKRMKEEGSEML